MIELSVGTIVKSKGKRGVIEERSDNCECVDCLFFPDEYGVVCSFFRCEGRLRKDGKNVMVREIKE